MKRFFQIPIPFSLTLTHFLLLLSVLFFPLEKRQEIWEQAALGSKIPNV